ncbi:MAG: DUF3987 domain-containing protein [Nodosilinea sp.]
MNFHGYINTPGQGFDIRTYLDRLEPSPKKDGKYICLVCGGNDLGINLKTGAYSCYSNDCATADIRNAIAPLPERQSDGHRPSSPPKRKPSARERERAVQLDSARVEAKVDELLLLQAESYHTLEQAQVELGLWCKTEGLNAYDATQLLRARAKELGAGGGDDASDIEPQDIARLQTIQQQRRNSGDYRIADFLPATLADAIARDAPVMNVAELAFMPYLLPLAGSLLPRKTSISAGSFSEPPIIWGCIVGESGSGKTRVQKILTAYLNRLERLEYERYQQDREDYDQAIAAAGREDPEPDKPSPRQRFVFGVSTPEAIVKNLGQQEGKGAAWVRDELRGLFDGLDQYRNGRGEGESILINLWDGAETAVDRVDEKKSFYAYANNLCIAGGIQPGVFTSAFSDPEDAQGLAARFLFLRVPSFPPRRTLGQLHLPALLEGIYPRLLQFPVEQIGLSPEADCLLTTLVADSEHLFSRDYRAITAWARKLPAHVLRVALVLHSIGWACDPTVDPKVLSEATLTHAHGFVLCCYESFSLIQREVGGGTDMAALIDRVLEVARAAGAEGVSIRDLYASQVQAIRAYAKILGRQPAALALDICRQMAGQGYGVVEEVRKNSYRFTAGE